LPLLAFELVFAFALELPPALPLAAELTVPSPSPLPLFAVGGADVGAVWAAGRVIDWTLGGGAIFATDPAHGGGPPPACAGFPPPLPAGGADHVAAGIVSAATEMTSAICRETRRAACRLFSNITPRDTRSPSND
jgi:hypothetical protein